MPRGLAAPWGTRDTLARRRAASCDLAARGFAPKVGDAMAVVVEFLFVILHYLIQAVVWLVVASVIANWLVAFDVINMRNRMANQVVRFLDAITRPVLRPLRRIIPPLGGIDISPAILIILLMAADQVLLPGAYAALVSHLT